MNRKCQEPTCTCLVEAALRAQDDFCTTKTLRELTKLSHNQVSASLCNLKNYKVAGSVESGGQLWWFAMPKEMDTRTRHVEQRVPETKPRKPRKRKVAP